MDVEYGTKLRDSIDRHDIQAFVVPNESARIKHMWDLSFPLSLSLSPILVNGQFLYFCNSKPVSGRTFCVIEATREVVGIARACVIVRLSARPDRTVRQRLRLNFGN